jgi:two-component system sensor histidine kinase DesK
VTAPYRTRLGSLRHLTLWTLLGFVGMVLAAVILELVRHRPAPLPVVVVLGLAAVGSSAMSAYLMVASVRPDGPPPLTRRAWLALGWAGAGAFVAPVVAPLLDRDATGAAPQWMVLPGLLTSAAVAGSGLPRMLTSVVGTVAAGVAGAGAAAVGGYIVPHTVFVAAAITAVCTLSVAAQIWFWDVAAQVDRARQVEGQAAVAGERLRFAAELHDIQGHSLQVIALKSELAARLVEADPSRAVAEMREVESLARQALRDTREVAHGYRTVSLGIEIANATRVLTAAGVRCATRQDDGLPAVGPGAERLLGLVVREATTNVIRHSRAAHAEIALTRHDGGVRLVVGNDAPLAPERATPGGGLAGLAERFASAGGTLRWRQDDDTFTVTAEVSSP